MLHVQVWVWPLHFTFVFKAKWNDINLWQTRDAIKSASTIYLCYINYLYTCLLNKQITWFHSARQENNLHKRPCILLFLWNISFILWESWYRSNWLVASGGKMSRRHLESALIAGSLIESGLEPDFRFSRVLFSRTLYPTRLWAIQLRCTEAWRRWRSVRRWSAMLRMRRSLRQGRRMRGSGLQEVEWWINKNAPLQASAQWRRLRHPLATVQRWWTHPMRRSCQHKCTCEFFCQVI